MFIFSGNSRHYYGSSRLDHTRHVCTKCFEVFKNRFSLEKHLLTECRLEKKHFYCKYCNFSSKSKRNLENHIYNRHPRPGNKASLFKCMKCAKTYRYKENLWRHQRYECGIEPQFQCSLCEQRFNQKSNLTRHILRRHPNI